MSALSISRLQTHQHLKHLIFFQWMPYLQRKTYSFSASSSNIHICLGICLLTWAQWCGCLASLSHCLTCCEIIFTVCPPYAMFLNLFQTKHCEQHFHHISNWWDCNDLLQLVDKLCHGNGVTASERLTKTHTVCHDVFFGRWPWYERDSAQQQQHVLIQELMGFLWANFWPPRRPLISDPLLNINAHLLSSWRKLHHKQRITGGTAHETDVLYCHM